MDRLHYLALFIFLFFRPQYYFPVKAEELKQAVDTDPVRNGAMRSQLQFIIFTRQCKPLDKLYLSVYSRLPSEQESKTIIAYLDGKTADRKKVLRDLVWAMLTSTEFVVNH